MRRLAMLALLSVPLTLAAQSTALVVPSPEAHFGFRMGSDGELADWTAMTSYFQTVAESSDRVELVEVGPTTDGQPIVAAIVSSPRNVERLEEIRTANLRLADPRAISESEARLIAARNPVVVAVGASIHASEIGATQMVNELVHELATTEAPDLLEVLDRVVLIVFPSLNPDGHRLVVDWYRRWKGTAFEGAPMPWLYHRYAGHDINRDAFMMNLAESRSLSAFFYRRWHPQVFLSMHQMGSRGPRYFVPPNYDPIDPNYDPLIWRAAGLLGHAMAMRLEQDERAGVVQNALYDYYWPGYEDSAPLGHNTVCLLTEAAGVRIATPIRVEASELQGSSRGLPEYRAQVNFPNPWKGGAWTLRNIVDYNASAVRGLLVGAARYRQELLSNFYVMGRRAVEDGARGGPFAFIIPAEQHDPHAAHKLRELLIDGAVEIHRAIEPFRVADTVYEAGTDLILMAQPFRAYAKTLLERQTYPVRTLAPRAPPERPYDVAGWTLPLQMGVSVDRIEQKFEPPPSTKLSRSSIRPANVWGEQRAAFYVVDGRGNGASLAINRLLAAGAEISWITQPIELLGFSYAPGAILVRDAPKVRPIVEGLAATFGLRVTAARGPLPQAVRRLTRARTGLYKPWIESPDEGWTRWLLEQYEFPFESLSNEDIRRGPLRERVDVIVLPDLPPDRLINGHPTGTMPDPYVGGLGADGVTALQQFVQDGGTLVALDSSVALVADALGLPVEDTVDGLAPDVFFAPGSIVGLTLDGAEPLAFGMPTSTAAFFAFSTALDVAGRPAAAGDSAHTPPAVRVIGRYATGQVLLSGWLEGAGHLEGRGAVIEAETGQGRAVLIGFRAQHRAQSHATFRLLFNAIHTSQARPLPRSRPRPR
ncbi:MAG: M14 family metallopeptidase [Acidobacteriota bacterium]